MWLKILNKVSFGAGPRLPTDRCGKTNCSNCAGPNCVGIACPPWLPAILPLQKAGPYPVPPGSVVPAENRGPQRLVGKFACLEKPTTSCVCIAGVLVFPE